MPFYPPVERNLAKKYHEPEHKVGSLVIYETTSLGDPGTFSFVIMPHIHVANCAAAFSVIFRNYSVYKWFNW
jgi:hypothetical protein